MHIDLTGMARAITWASFFGVMLSFSLFLGLLGWAFASIYNRIDAAPNG